MQKETCQSLLDFITKQENIQSTFVVSRSTCPGPIKWGNDVAVLIWSLSLRIIPYSRTTWSHVTAAIAESECGSVNQCYPVCEPLSVCCFCRELGGPPRWQMSGTVALTPLSSCGGEVIATYNLWLIIPSLFFTDQGKDLILKHKQSFWCENSD